MQRHWFSLGAPRNTSCWMSQVASDAPPLHFITISSGEKMGLCWNGNSKKNHQRIKHSKRKDYEDWHNSSYSVGIIQKYHRNHQVTMVTCIPWQVHTFPLWTGKGTRVPSTDPTVAADREMMRKTSPQVDCSSFIWYFSPIFLQLASYLLLSWTWGDLSFPGCKDKKMYAA